LEKEDIAMALQFIGFPSIEGFHNVVKSTAGFLAIEPPLEWPYQGYIGPLRRGTATYRGKIKLHGTNAGIRIGGGEVAAQSRTQIITPTADNSGFARWVESQADYWKGVSRDEITVFGEFCGPGIMKGTAINKIPTKIFAIFAVRKNGDLISESAEIEALLPNRPADVHVLPWHGESFMVDFNDRVALQAVADKLNGVVAEVEPVDPWVAATFGVEGAGEGVVYYPGAGETHSVKFFSDFAFKAKGEKHKVTKTREAVQIDPEVAAGIDGFVSMFVTEARLEQGLAAIGGSTEMKNVGPFLKWMSQDVSKESADELEAAGLTWEQVQKGVQTASRNWFVAKNRTI
jgi:hypothetical protein